MPKLAAAMLREGSAVSDAFFEQVYPTEVRFLSHQHWTPIAVAVRAARLLAGAGATSILDVGSGPGKFCIVGALTTTASFLGVERRPWLIDVARAAALAFGAERAAFVRADMVDFDFGRCDGFYLFNPFYEQVDGGLLPVDAELAGSKLLYLHYVDVVRTKLAALAPGTAVVTYHGFGGSMPSTFDRVYHEPAGNDRLELWIKSHGR
jgi:SAM-dependent methyltransferase